MLKKPFNMSKRLKIYNHFLIKLKEVAKTHKILFQTEWRIGLSRLELLLNNKTRERENEMIKLKKLLIFWTDLKILNKMKINSFKTNSQFYKRFKLMIDQMLFRKVFKLNLMELTLNLNGLQMKETHWKSNLMMLWIMLNKRLNTSKSRKHKSKLF